MRHAWTEELNVAPSGAVDEFRRKKARNDYPVMALWEMGLRGLRVPLQDLMDTATRRRMEIMFGVGHKFHIYRYGIPTKIEIETIKKHFSIIEELELVLGWETIDEQVSEIQFPVSYTHLTLPTKRIV